MAPHVGIQSAAPSLGSEAFRVEVQRLLGFILRRPIGEEENPSRKADPGWDSLRHVELVFLFEDHFGIRFSEQEIADLEDSVGLERLVEARLHEKTLFEEGAGFEGTDGGGACGTTYL